MSTIRYVLSDPKGMNTLSNVQPTQPGVPSVVTEEAERVDISNFSLTPRRET